MLISPSPMPITHPATAPQRYTRISSSPQPAQYGPSHLRHRLKQYSTLAAPSQVTYAVPHRQHADTQLSPTAREPRHVATANTDLISRNLPYKPRYLGVPAPSTVQKSGDSRLSSAHCPPHTAHSNPQPYRLLKNRSSWDSRTLSPARNVAAIAPANPVAGIRQAAMKMFIQPSVDMRQQ